MRLILICGYKKARSRPGLGSFIRCAAGYRPFAVYAPVLPNLSSGFGSAAKSSDNRGHPVSSIGPAFRIFYIPPTDGRFPGFLYTAPGGGFRLAGFVLDSRNLSVFRFQRIKDHFQRSLGSLFQAIHLFVVHAQNTGDFRYESLFCDDRVS